MGKTREVAKRGAKSDSGGKEAVEIRGAIEKICADALGEVGRKLEGKSSSEEESDDDSEGEAGTKPGPLARRRSTRLATEPEGLSRRIKRITTELDGAPMSPISVA